MTRLAARTDSNQADIVDALRKAGAQVYLTHRVGGGFPDLVCGYKGHTILIESKTLGGALNKKQRLFFDLWVGGYAYVIRNIADALCVLGGFDEENHFEPIGRRR